MDGFIFILTIIVGLALVISGGLWLVALICWLRTKLNHDGETK